MVGEGTLIARTPLILREAELTLQKVVHIPVTSEAKPWNSPHRNVQLKDSPRSG